jgi:signal transduction histidine kinase/CheY-like chemotaxis protein/ABC-type amino acid transport substrate-binding protein
MIDVLLGLLLVQIAGSTSARALAPEPMPDSLERAWIASHPVVRYRAGDFAPFSFPLGGQQRGFSLDIAQRILGAKGIRLEAVSGITQSESIRALGSRKVDLLLTLPQVVATAAGVSATRPYKASQFVVFCRSNDWKVSGVSSLEGVTLAVVEGGAMDRMLAQKIRDLRVLQVHSTAEALQAVFEHRAEAYVEELETGLFYLRILRMEGIRVAGEFSTHHLGYVMVVRDDWPELRSILDKGLASMSQATLDSLFERHQIATLPDASRHRWLLWLVTAGCIAAALLGRISWTFRRRLGIIAREHQSEIERLPVGIFRVAYRYGTDGSILERKLLFASRNCLDLLGGALPATLEEWIEWVHPDDREAAVAFGTGRFRKPEERVLDVRLPLLDEVRYLRIHCHPATQGPDRVEWHGILSDATSERTAQEAQLSAERQLLHARKLENLGVLAAGIAHDFNNSLMAILANLELARNDPEGRQTPLDRAIRATLMAVDLTRQILSFSGRGGFELRSIDLAGKVRENIGLFRAAIPRSVRLDVELPSHPLMIRADPGQVQQVLMNLITNAADAIAGSGTIRIEGGIRAFDFADLFANRSGSLAEPGSYAWVRVADDGCGMDETVIESIFEPFFTTKPLGRGLGMAAMQGILRAHDGAIFVESEVGFGTSMTVLFPHFADPVAVERACGVAWDPLLRTTENRQILVIEDEPLVRESLCGILRSMGHLVAGAENGEAGLEALQALEGPVVVLLDMSLPGEHSGVDLLRTIRRERPDVKVVLVSGFDRQEVETRCGADRPDGFLQKPFLVRDLQERLVGLASS